MKTLGAFSISLSVKDIYKSKDFYEKLGFEVLGGEIAENWIIMHNDDCVIGLFQEMFEKNILTFNPGWNKNAENLDEFMDIRDIQTNLKNKGIKILVEVEPNTEGLGSFVLEDPDGNPILFDQHRK